MQIQTEDFKSIVKRIEAHKILLPDFQREFVWKDVNMQKQIIASVFAKMPIGSILLLKSSPKEFASKNIGSKIEIDSAKLHDEVSFLLDGQQRVTVLSNAFSDIIFEQCENKVSNLISPSLKRRFFIKIPKWKEFYDPNSELHKKDYTDIFGIKKFEFPLQDASGEVEFLTSEVIKYIHTEDFRADDSTVFNPKHPLDTDLDKYCFGSENGYFIPLYLLIATPNNAAKLSVRRKSILEGIASCISKEIIDEFIDLKTVDKQGVFLKDILNNTIINNVLKEKEIDDRIKVVEKELSDKAVFWVSQMENYIESCLTRMALNEIEIAFEQRARAIDIYENLNRGGISLSTFDLIMARVAIVSKENFYKRMVSYIKGEKNYDEKFLPNTIKNSYKEFVVTRGKYNASVETKCYSDNKNTIDSKYIDAFLDVLSLYCNNIEYNTKKYTIELIKRNRILALEPEEINNNCEKICNAIDRALFFFQVRCGIRNIREINYSLMLVLVATIFSNDKYFENEKVHEYLEGWYWASIFSGEFDQDQNAMLIRHLKQIINYIEGQGNCDWIKSMSERILNNNNFSDEKLLLMDKVNEDRYPKIILRAFISQYFLSQTYSDMFEDHNISVFSDCADNLELHHIIPLGSVNQIGESSEKLRENKKHICNSPLNFVYITKKSNIFISNKSLEDYSRAIQVKAKSVLQISSFGNKTSIDSDDKIKQILMSRYQYLQGAIKTEVSNLLPTK